MTAPYHGAHGQAFHDCDEHPGCRRVVSAAGERHVTVRTAPPGCGICAGRDVATPHHCHVERDLWRELAECSVDPREEMGDYRDDDPADHGVDVHTHIENQLGWHELKLRRRWQRAAL